MSGTRPGSRVVYGVATGCSLSLTNALYSSRDTFDSNQGLGFRLWYSLRPPFTTT